MAGPADRADGKAAPDASGERVEPAEKTASAEGPAPDADGDSPASDERHGRRAKRTPKRYAEHFDHIAAASDPKRQVPALTVRQVHDRLDLIERRRPLYAPWQSGLAAGLACAAFVFLLGGGIYDMVGAFVGAGLGQWLRRRLFAKHLNQFFVTFVCVAVAALACTGVLRVMG